MKSEVINVSNRGQGMDNAVALADKTAKDLGLSRRETLHMQLLVEEVINMMSSIIGQLEGKLFIETDEGAYRVILQTKTLMDREQRAQMLSASTSGKNKAHRGIMGKLRAFFEPLPIDTCPALVAETVIPGDEKGDLTWSLNAYRERLQKQKDSSEGALEEWDELEKSVVSHIADNIEISIRGYDVELVMFKKIAR